MQSLDLQTETRAHFAVPVCLACSGVHLFPLWLWRSLLEFVFVLLFHDWLARFRQYALCPSGLLEHVAVFKRQSPVCAALLQPRHMHTCGRVFRKDMAIELLPMQPFVMEVQVRSVQLRILLPACFAPWPRAS